MITVVWGDITEQQVDVIVNAANNSLLGGGGVDGAIHRAGGPEILQACEMLRATEYPLGLPTGEAVATTAGALAARWVVHTVGPVYLRSKDAPAQLRSAYENSLRVASSLGAKTIAFPGISTGVYGYPKLEAAEIAVAAALAHEAEFEEIRLVAFSEADCQVLRAELRRQQG